MRLTLRRMRNLLSVLLDERAELDNQIHVVRLAILREEDKEFLSGACPHNPPRAESPIVRRGSGAVTPKS